MGAGRLLKALLIVKMRGGRQAPLKDVDGRCGWSGMMMLHVLVYDDAGRGSRRDTHPNARHTGCLAARVEAQSKPTGAAGEGGCPGERPAAAGLGGSWLPARATGSAGYTRWHPGRAT